MKNKIFISLLFLIFLASLLRSSGQNISGVINVYTKVTAFGNCNSMTVASIAGYTIGDTILIIQMKGAVTDTISNNTSFGSIINYNESGNYEFNIIKSFNGNNVFLKNVLLNSYDPSGLVQMIRVPYYNSVNVSGTLLAAPWNGNTGGVLVFLTSGTLTLNANIDVSGLGFRGGSASVSFWSGCSFLDYFNTIASGTAGQKGEGISNYGITYECGRGPLANGGGGGNQSNAGGGGGANFGAGGKGGDQENFSCTTQPLGGLGGNLLNYNSSQNKIFLGGGGGGGHQNNNVGTGGTNGGGIIIIRANTIVGNNFSIKSNGLDNLALAQYDGSGGAGAGGTIMLDVMNYNLPLNVQVNGGKGGSSNFSTCFGIGGGGGGGLVWSSGPSFPVNVTLSFSGGLSGTHVAGGACANSSYGALLGSSGGILNGLQLAQSNIAVGPAITINNSQTICQGQSYSINGNSYSTSGSYYDTLLNSSGCDSIIITTLTVNSGLNINYMAEICEGDSYIFPDGTISNTATTHSSFFYSGSGCDSIIQTILTVNPLPAVEFSMYPDSASIEDPKILFTDLTGGSVAWHWNFGDSSGSQIRKLIHQFGDTGIFHISLEVTDGHGCKNVKTGDVYIRPEFVFFIPNAFSPNDDGMNDVFMAKAIGVKEFTMIIFDRWGQEIFKTNDFNRFWDGNNMPMDTYVYKINLIDVGRSAHEYLGRVSIVK